MYYLDGGGGIFFYFLHNSNSVILSFFTRPVSNFTHVVVNLFMKMYFIG